MFQMDVSLDPEMHAEMVTRAKKQIRARMKALRGGHSAASLRVRSDKIVERLLASESIKQAKSVASFWPMTEAKEIDLRGLDSELRERGVSLYYPFMDRLPDGGFKTGFRRTSSASDLKERGQRFFEPEPHSPVASSGDVDVVLVPALAADARGHRIGYGAGYYDATLSDVCPPARGLIVAYQFQMMAELPAEPHDVPCACVFTDTSTYEV
jgi:5-formyltetrahydrofolate cyclo-ligase